MHSLDIPWERVKEAKNRIDTAFELKQPDLMPLDFRVDGFRWDRITVKQRMLDQELALRERIEFINYQYAHFPDNDFLPILDVNTGEVVIPSAFGVGYVYPENNMPWCKKDYVIKDIKKEVERIVSLIGQQGGIILGSTSEIHSGIPAQNCKYLYEVIKEYGSKL